MSSETEAQGDHRLWFHGVADEALKAWLVEEARMAWREARRQNIDSFVAIWSGHVGRSYLRPKSAAPARGEGREARIGEAASRIVADVIEACAVAEGFISYADSDWSVPGTDLRAGAVERIRAALTPSSPEELLAEEILAELRRARAKFPGDNVTTLALVEEVGELAKATFEERRERVREEAVQVATMAMRVALDGDSTLDGWRAAKGLDPLVALTLIGEP